MINFKINRRAVFAGGLALSACGGGNRARILRSADSHAEGYPTVQAVRAFGAELAKVTDNRLQVDMFAGGQLGGERDTLEIAMFGGIDFNRVNLAPLNTFAPETIVPSLPFIFSSVTHMRASMDGAPGQKILASLEQHGLIGLCFYDSGARSFYTRDRLIKTPDDLRGLKIRVQNSDIYVSMVEALGGDATPMGFGEVYQGLVQGVVDGAENNWPSYDNTRHHEAAPFYSLTRHVMAPEVFVMSAKRWKKLSSADQELIRTAARKSVGVMRQLWDARVESSQAKLRADGIKIFEPDLTPFRAAVKPVWDKYLTTPAIIDLADAIEALG